MAFYQAPPQLKNQFTDDPLLQEYLARKLPAEALPSLAGPLSALGELSGGLLYRLQLADRHSEPRLLQWDAWGHRVDFIEVTRLWHEAAGLAAGYGVVAAAYEPGLGELARIDQFARAYLFHPSTDVYSCPLAMTDGAARTLLDLDNRPLIERAVPHLTSRDPAQMWTSGQWMTERTGGSDVGLAETVARRESSGGKESWRLYGTKWFTSATTSQMALTLARPEGNGPGGRGLALFYVELRGADGRYNGIQVNRLKEKLGTRKVPTAELLLDGTLATPVAGLSDGVRNISSMLNITRTWNAAMSASSMRRAVALCRDYAQRRVAFGTPLAEKPLHQDTLAAMQSESEAAFLLAFRAVELLGRVERRLASSDEVQLLRLLTPLAKLTTGKQAVAVASEALEACGGAGYVEDTGLPLLLRDAQVLPIWEGTTNVLALDLLKAMRGSDGLRLLRGEALAQLREVTADALRPAAVAVERTFSRCQDWFDATSAAPLTVEAGARRLALTIGRSLALALLCGHAQWCIDAQRGRRAVAAAQRFWAHGIDLLGDGSPADFTERQAATQLLAAGGE